MTPKYTTTRYGYTGDKSRFLPLEAAKRRLVKKYKRIFEVKISTLSTQKVHVQLTKVDDPGHWGGSRIFRSGDGCYGVIFIIYLEFKIRNKNGTIGKKSALGQ